MGESAEYKGGYMIIAYLKDEGIRNRYELTKSSGTFGYVFGNSIPKDCVEFEDGIEILPNEVYKICIQAMKVVRSSDNTYPSPDCFDDGYDGDGYKIIQMKVNKVEMVVEPQFEPINIRTPQPVSTTWGTTGSISSSSTCITYESSS